MPDRLNLATSLLNVAGGQTLAVDPLGFAILSAPRKAARGRAPDVLFLCLGLRSRGHVAPERHAPLLDLAAATFYGSPGSITAALRLSLAAVNQALLESNLRAAGTPDGPGAMPVQAGLMAAALRGTDLYAVQCGPGMLIVARGLGFERFPNLPSRPLGLSNALDTHYFHTGVNEGEYVCLSHNPPPGWNEIALAGLGSLSTLSGVADRLRETAHGDFAAIVGRFEPAGEAAAWQPAPEAAAHRASGAPVQSGAGQMAALGARLSALFKRPAASAPDDFASAPLESEAAVEPAAAGPQAMAPAEAAVTEAADLPPQAAPVPEAEPAAASASETDWQALLRRTELLGHRAEPAGDDSPPHVPVVEEDAPASAAAQAEPDEERFTPAWSERLAPLAAPLRRGVKAIGRAFGVTLTEITRSLRRLIARTLPEGTLQREGMFVVPNSVLIGIAIGIPILVSLIAGGLYIQRGRAQLFDDALTRAQEEVVTARLMADPLQARPHWAEALTFLAQAEQINPGDAGVAALRQEAQGRLDELDWVTRLDFRPLVVGGLGRGAKIRQILLVGQDVYALDEARNRVFRLAPSATLGYVVDPDFECFGSRDFNQLRIGTLLDIGWLPGPNPIGADAIVAFDTTGGLLYCAPGRSPLAIYLPAPDTSWIRPAAIEFYADSLYVLDPGGNQIWQFLNSAGDFQPPRSYFTSVVYDLSDVVEFSIAGGEVFMLRKDGRVMDCSRIASGDATCQEAAPFTDLRAGRTSGDRLADVAAPRLLAYDPPPEPSLYLLDHETSGIYQLSLKLALVRQFRPAQPLPDRITSLAIDAAKRVFVGAGDNVYLAARP